jgi:hypothetical protein
MPSIFIGKKNAINNLYENAVNINANTSPVNYSGGVGTVKSNFDGIDTALAANFPVVSDTGTGKTLALTDRNTIQALDNSGTITINIPTNASVAFPSNGATIINFIQINTGQITFTVAGGVALLSYLSKVTTAGQYAQCTLVKIDTNVWMLTGALI